MKGFKKKFGRYVAMLLAFAMTVTGVPNAGPLALVEAYAATTPQNRSDYIEYTSDTSWGTVVDEDGNLSKTSSWNFATSNAGAGGVGFSVGDSFQNAVVAGTNPWSLKAYDGKTPGLQSSDGSEIDFNLDSGTTIVDVKVIADSGLGNNNRGFTIGTTPNCFYLYGK